MPSNDLSDVSQDGNVRVTLASSNIQRPVAVTFDSGGGASKMHVFYLYIIW